MSIGFYLEEMDESMNAIVRHLIAWVDKQYTDISEFLIADNVIGCFPTVPFITIL